MACIQSKAIRIRSNLARTRKLEINKYSVWVRRPKVSNAPI